MRCSRLASLLDPGPAAIQLARTPSAHTPSSRARLVASAWHALKINGRQLLAVNRERSVIGTRT